MNNLSIEKNNAQVARWLLLGAIMIIVQVMLGGITRLTESGLSITEWKPLTGILPPIGDAAWQAEFDKYKNTDQFKYVHQHFSLSDFKFIFFWEWFHRIWARLLAVVFAIGFVYFLVKKKFNKAMVTPMIILFLLGGIQGFVGWFMVKSGLVPEKYFVGHVELTTHFVSAVILLAYVLWFAFMLMPSMQQKVFAPPLKKMALAIIILLFVQLIYGGFMAGLRAAIAAPTWPSINGYIIPPTWMEQSPTGKNFSHNPLMVHFIHRAIAYLLLVLSIIFLARANRVKQSPVFSKFVWVFTALMLVQVLLGIFTVLFSTNSAALVLLGVLHQLNAMFLVCAATGIYYLLKQK